MKRPLIALFLVIINLTCKAQDTAGSKKHLQPKTTEKFDIYSFNKNRRWYDTTYIDTDGSKVRLQGSVNGYLQTRSTKGSPYRVYKRYYYPSLLIRSQGNGFYDVAYGKYLEYDTLGNVSQLINRHSLFKFSVQNLIDKALNHFKIDLRIDKPGINVKRYVSSDTKLPKYEIWYTISPSKVRVIILDGNNGKVITDRTVGVVE